MLCDNSEGWDDVEGGREVVLLFILFVWSVHLLFTLSALFARAKRLEEDMKSPSSCRHVYSLRAGTAAVAEDITQHNHT